MTTVLFLCTGNSSRSIIAEALLTAKGQGRFRALSAGSFPVGSVNPQALATLAAHDIATQNLHSKSWDVYAQTPIDIVITVCDAAAGESCPLFPGKPLKAHWGVPDPKTAADFEAAYAKLAARIDSLLALGAPRPHESDWQTAFKHL